MSWTTVIALFLLMLILFGGICFNVFIEVFRPEISSYIKACAEARRNKNKRFETLERALEQWQKNNAAKGGDENHDKV